MKFLAVFVLIIVSSLSLANDTSNFSGKWICYAEGKESIGGPFGNIWTTVTGKGATEFEAIDRAIRNCHMQNLDMCFYSSCHEKK